MNFERLPTTIREDQSIECETELSAVRINMPANYQRSSNTGITARRSGSSSILVRDEAGVVKVERKNTNADLMIAVNKRLSQSSLPSIFSSQSKIPLPDAPPLLGAEDALERIGGKGAAGAFCEHLYPLESVSEHYFTQIDYRNVDMSTGLSAKKAAELLQEYGPNVLTPPPKIPLWLLFLLQFTNVLMVLLMIVATICIILFIVDPSVLANLYIGVLLFVAVFITCYETYSQEAKSDSLMEKFRAMVPAQASVIRDGVMKPTEASQIVIGDLIRLKSGDKVPADCRIISNSSMKVCIVNFCVILCFNIYPHCFSLLKGGPVHDHR